MRENQSEIKFFWENSLIGAAVKGSSYQHPRRFKYQNRSKQTAYTTVAIGGWKKNCFVCETEGCILKRTQI
jgi:hypothetical protein